MPSFRYQALDADGRTRRGTLSADNDRAARAQLRAQGWVPLKVQPRAPRRLGRARRGWTATELANWTRQLAVLVGSGLPLERALAALADEVEDPRQHAVLTELRADVGGGSTLAQALQRQPHLFDAPYCAVVAAGEASGQLGTMLHRAAQQMADDAQRRTLRLTTWLEPLLIIAMGGVVLVIVLAVMLPIIQLNQLVR